MITSNIENYIRYCFNPDFKMAFEFLTTTDLDSLPLGKSFINDNISITKDNYKTLCIGETFWEAHKRFIDIQYIHCGSEKIAYSSISALNEVFYNEEKDLSILKGPINSIFQICKNDFAIFFPEDAHMPCLNTSMNCLEVTKIVVKIKLSH